MEILREVASTSDFLDMADDPAKKQQICDSIVDKLVLEIIETHSTEVVMQDNTPVTYTYPNRIV